MNKPSTRREECEKYPRDWHSNNVITQELWQQTLNMLYEGKGASAIVASLGLPDGCRRSLQQHRKEHLGYILFRYGAGLKDKRLQMAGTLTAAYRQLIEKCFALAIDEAVRPEARLRATEIAQREMAELQRLAQLTVDEFEKHEKEDGRETIRDVQAMVRQIRADVFGLADAGDGGGGGA